MMRTFMRVGVRYSALSPRGKEVLAAERAEKIALRAHKRSLWSVFAMIAFCGLKSITA